MLKFTFFLSYSTNVKPRPSLVKLVHVRITHKCYVSSLLDARTLMSTLSSALGCFNDFNSNVVMYIIISWTLRGGFINLQVQNMLCIIQPPSIYGTFNFLRKNCWIPQCSVMITLPHVMLNVFCNFVNVCDRS
ncbi:hypothetical protein NP493_1133g00006 [Ridgeia piscesae]|uniref:Uncharacterized protein n=1 Tax=Ridgeia piscesae TaxID=27915 RepID=A0AAD9KHF1_RIDPI|nr:hypothetical protein NP493_1133g00006 [Ridgeia piscesae]